MNIDELSKKPWWNYIEGDLRELLTESILLVEETKDWESKFHDWSFVVFPAAKAYEGYLKKFLLDMGLIGEKDYFGKHFRIGKSLNPSLPKKLREEDWVYEKLSRFCKGKSTPDLLWETWKNSRNLVFHWFPDRKNVLSRKNAIDRISSVINAIDESYGFCET